MLHHSLREFPNKTSSVHTPSATLRNYVNVWMYILFSVIGVVCILGRPLPRRAALALKFARLHTDLELTHN